MATKPSCSLAFVIFSWAFMGFCQGQGQGQGGGGGGGGNGGNPECVSKLLPCQPYLHSATPPGSCCVPLKEVVEKDVKCLCEVFNNPAIMKSLNVTQDDALKLAKTCGANADTSLCKTAASPTVSPGTPTSSNSSSTNSTASAPAKSAATTHVMISHFGGSLSLAILLSLLLFAF